MENRIERMYTNSVGVNLNAVDITLNFSDQRNLGADEAGTVAQVVMSPQLAKSLTLVLQQNIVDYEKIFGLINLEPDKAALANVQARAQAQAQAIEQRRA